MLLADYIRDETEHAPTLNASTAHLLLTRSPLHAWHHHPKLNPRWEPEEATRFDVGTAAHAILLEDRGDLIQVIDAPHYRKKAAQDQREYARENGRIPILAHVLPDIEGIVSSAKTALGSSDLTGLGTLSAEKTFVWNEGGVWCRCRPDWISYNRRVIISFKTTSASAEPEAYLRTILSSGYEMQAAAELLGSEASTDRDNEAVSAKYVWLVTETEPPYASSLLGLSPDLEEYARERFRVARNLWRVCLATNLWPGYPERIAWLETPPWQRGNWTEKMNREGL